MHHRFVVWAFPVMPALAVAITVLALTPTRGAAQSLVVSPRVTLMGGDESAASAGLRAEVGSSRFALFGQLGGFAASQECSDLIAPQRCSTPSSSGLELLGGVRLALPRLGPVRPAISLGVGALLWDDFRTTDNGTGSIWEAELRVGVTVASWADLLLGTVVKSVGNRAGGTTLVPDRGTYGGIVVGLLIPVM